MMRPSLLLFVPYFVLVISVHGFLDYEIIEAYFRKRFIHYATIIGCFSKKEQLKIAKQFNPKPMTSVLNINQIHLQQALETTGHLGVILDGDCDGVDNILSTSGKQRYFNVRYHWLILVSSRNCSMFNKVEMYINADIQIVYPQNNFTSAKNYTIQAIYNPSSVHGGTIKSYTVGFYNPMNGYSFREDYSRYTRRKNMTGVHLKTVVVLPAPFNGTLLEYLDSEEDRDINTFNRYAHNLFSMCQRVYNFTKEVRLTNSWGYLQKDGTFDGEVGILGRKEADYGISPMLVKIDRSHVVQFGRRIWNLRTAFIFRNPKSLTSIEGFVKPLSYSTWALTVVSAALLMILLRLSCLYERQTVDQHVDMTWSYFIVCTIGALCQQGMSATPKISSGRIVTLFLFLFSLLIYQFYSASIVSNLLMEPPTKIKTLDDITRSNMEAGCEDILYTRVYFKTTTDKASKKLYSGKLLGPNGNPNFMAPVKGLRLVAKGQYAFLVETSVAYPIIRDTFKEEAICELRQVQLYGDQLLHIIFQKNSPFKETIDTCLQRLAEVGIMTRETIFWEPAKPQCILSSKTGTFNIGLDEFYPALALLVFGMVCSLAVLLFEIICFHKSRSRGEKQKKVLIHPFRNDFNKK